MAIFSMGWCLGGDGAGRLPPPGDAEGGRGGSTELEPNGGSSNPHLITAKGGICWKWGY